MPNGSINLRQPHFFRKPTGEYARPIFKPEGLKRLAAQLPHPPDSDYAMRAYGLALFILQYYFGCKWVERHILDEPKDGFLARPLTATEGIEIGCNKVVHRVRDLAELIINLDVGGVEAPLCQLYRGEIESAYAELEVGKLLFCHNIDFRFVWPSGKGGESFDLEVIFPSGIKVCADAKCKYEEKTFSASGLINTLNDARRRNLPKGHPGAIFVKVPQLWFESVDTMQLVVEACDTFLRGTRRIVSVEIFSPIFVMKNDRVDTSNFAGVGISNQSHDFDISLTSEPLLFGHPATSGRAANWKRIVDITRHVE